jgi:DNA segregation ATPase FtsK/SpoIIIE, S-DNA-T family
MSGNTLKNTTNKKKSQEADFKPEPKKKQISNGLPFYKQEKNKRILGLLFLLLGVFFLVALASYIKTWAVDQDKVMGTPIIDFLFADGYGVQNKFGRLGALTAHGFAYKGIGVLAFLIVPVFVGIGYNLFSPKYRFSLLSYLKYALLMIAIGSPLLAYIFDKNIFRFGGAYGNSVAQFLINFAGQIGTGFILGVSILSVLIYFFNDVITMPSMPKLPSLGELKTTDIARENKQDDKVATTLLNDAYEHGEGTLEVHHTFVKQEPLQEVKLAVNNNGIKEEEDILPDDAIPFATATVNKDFTTTELDINTPEKVSMPAGDVQLEVVTHEEEDIPVVEVHTSVEGLDPYDPSLDLRNYKFPTIDLLEDRGSAGLSVTAEELEQNKNQIIQTLKNFGINIAKISATVGPTVTLYEIVPAEGVRISKIRNLEDDIALSLSALGIRIIAPIPGKGTIGIEVPNLKKQIVNMRTLIASDKFVNNNYSLPIAIGKKIDNENFVVDLATMPHLLMAGATGQGKSVGLNAILVSLLYKKHPSQLKFVLVDPKKVELSIYKHIEKHFLAKLPNEEEAIITDTKKVVNTLNSLCIEMDKRYDLLKDAAVRNIKEYNEKFIKRKLNPEKGHHYMPFIVLVVDEFADLIMTAGKEVEMPIARLAQLARAIGIHLIIATQRPSVNVITGTIKANFPARIAFRVSAKVDSRTILDAGGAEQLVGKGDLLISNGSELTRVQCAFVDTPEVDAIIKFIGDQQGYPSAFDLPEYVGAEGDMEISGGGKSLTDLDAMFEQCARLVVTSNSGSTSMLQRRFNLGYNRAGRIMDQLEAAGIVGPSVGGKPRDLIVKTEMELEETLLRLNLR